MTPQDPAADTGAPGSARRPDAFDRWAADNGSRSTDDPKERQHLEEGPGVRHWWRCIPLESVDRIVDQALAASQPSAAAAQGPGITDERAIRRDALNDVLANIAGWPVASDKIDHGAYGRGQVIGYLEGLILEADRVLDQPSIAEAEAALAARPGPDPAGAPFDAPATCARPGCGHDKGFHWGVPGDRVTRGPGHGYCTSPGTSAAHCVAFVESTEPGDRAGDHPAMALDGGEA